MSTKVIKIMLILISLAALTISFVAFRGYLDCRTFDLPKYFKCLVGIEERDVFGDCRALVPRGLILCEKHTGTGISALIVSLVSIFVFFKLVITRKLSNESS